MKTAVSWLETELIVQNSNNFINEEFHRIISEAKAMFEQQIIDAHIEGFYSPPFGKGRNGEAQEYFNKTFKKK